MKQVALGACMQFRAPMRTREREVTMTTTPFFSVSICWSFVIPVMTDTITPAVPGDCLAKSAKILDYVAFRASQNLAREPSSFGVLRW